MAHPEQAVYLTSVKAKFPDRFKNCRVLDIGSLDINGNNRYLFENIKEYTGVDIGPGPNVDVVCRGHEYDGGKDYDVVISSETFEHDEYWEQTLQHMVDLTKPGGLVMFTCASIGRPEHGTRRTSPQDSPFTSQLDNDYYKNLDSTDIRRAIDMDSFSDYGFEIRYQWPQDLYFYGIKKA